MDPFLELTPIAGPVAGGQTYSVRWTLRDGSVSRDMAFTVDHSQDGTHWQTVDRVLVGSDGPIRSQEFEASWEVPQWDTNSAKINLEGTELSG